MPWRPPRPLNPLPQRCRRLHHPPVLCHPPAQRASRVAQMPHLSMPSGMWRLPNDPYRESLPYRRLCHAVSPPNRHSLANPSSFPSSFNKTASPQPRAKPHAKPPKPPRKPPHRKHTPPHPLKAPSFAKTLHQNNPTESHHAPMPKSSQTIMPIAGKFVNKSLRKRREYAVMRLFWT